VQVRTPEVSVYPYASITGAQNTTVKKFFTSFERGAPPESNNLNRPPIIYLNRNKIV
jgi:hypothetical protein